MHLQITAHLSTPFIAQDNWSPSIDNLLIWLLLDRHNLCVNRPTPEIAARNQAFIDEHLPIQKGQIKGEWYHQVSSPLYTCDNISTDYTTRRWDRQEQHLDWRGKAAKWNSQGFHTRSMLHHWKIVETSRLDWLCNGDIDGIKDLLSINPPIGKFSKGIVSKWVVSEIDADNHLFIGSELVRPIPVHLVDKPLSNKRLRWGWRSPVNIPQNIAECYMP